MSFAFRTISDNWLGSRNGGVVRELVDVELLDVSVVAYPAHAATTVGVRAGRPANAALRPARSLEVDARGQVVETRTLLARGLERARSGRFGERTPGQAARRPITLRLQPEGHQRRIRAATKERNAGSRPERESSQRAAPEDRHRSCCIE
jgi:Caudovirus prohead serine protease